MGWLMKLLRRLFPRLSRHRTRRDEDLQGRPAQPEVEAARAQVEAVMLRRYADRTKSRSTPGRKGWGNKRIHARSDAYWNRQSRPFGNPRWMRAEGVTPFGISSRWK